MFSEKKRKWDGKVDERSGQNWGRWHEEIGRVTKLNVCAKSRKSH